MDLKNIELKTSEGNHIINEYLYNEEIIVKEINANIKVNQIMHPIFDNLMLEKKEYDRLKHLNNQKEFKLGILIKSLMEIELNENFENKRKRINEIKDLIKIEKENIFKVNCQTNILNFMLNSRKNDLILKKQPVIKALKRAPKLTEKTENEIENLNTKIKALNQIYVSFSLNFLHTE